MTVLESRARVVGSPRPSLASQSAGVLTVRSPPGAARRLGWMTASQSARVRLRVVATVVMQRWQQMAQPALVRTTYR
jgi:hypothetical protein